MVRCHRLHGVLLGSIPALGQLEHLRFTWILLGTTMLKTRNTWSLPLHNAGVRKVAMYNVAHSRGDNCPQHCPSSFCAGNSVHQNGVPVRGSHSLQDSRQT
jgi:hypothetical protein